MTTPPAPALLLFLVSSSLLLASSTYIPRPSITTTTNHHLLPTSPSTTPISTTFSTLAAAFAAASPETLLNYFCRHTSFPKLCLNSIHDAEPYLTTVNSSTVLAALLKAVDTETRAALAAARKLVACSGNTARMAELLRDCVVFYGDALDNLESAKAAIVTGDAGTRDAMLSAMIDQFSTCDDGFGEFDVKSPLAGWCRMLSNMTDNCLAVANLGRPHGGY